MKSQEKIAQMDEIVFEKRNKMYGAYILRKMYNKQLNKALLLAVAILAAGLAYPLVESFNSLDGVRLKGDIVVTDLIDLPEPKDEIKPEIPEAPEAKPETRIRFVAPDITTDEVLNEEGLPSMEDMNLTTVNIPVDVSFEKPAEKPEEIIENPENAAPLLIVEEMPTFPGGDTERLRFLAGNIVYPQIATENGIQGTVYFQFVVDSKGNITDVKILRGIGGGCDEEALRVIKMMPQWKPGRQNGRTVRVIYNMPVVFKIQ